MNGKRTDRTSAQHPNPTRHLNSFGSSSLVGEKSHDRPLEPVLAKLSQMPRLDRHKREKNRQNVRAPPRPGIWRRSRARSQALQARRSSRTPPRSNVHHETWVLGVRWAAGGRRSHASQSLPSAKCKVQSATCRNIQGLRLIQWLVPPWFALVNMAA